MYKYITRYTENINFTGDVLGLDIETSGLNIRKDKILLLQLSDGINTYIFDARILNKQYLISILDQNKDKIFVSHNSKFDLGMLYSNFNYLLDKIHCTMLAEAVISPGKGKLIKSLKDVVAERFNIEIDKSLTTSFLTPTRSFSQDQLEYAAQDALLLLDIYASQSEEIEEGGLSTIMQIENKLIPVVMKMEYNGITLSEDRLYPVIEMQEEIAERHAKELFKIAGREFNPRSPKQVKEVFHELSEKTKNLRLKVDSTGEPVIKHINHPFVRHLLGYRAANKLVSTYGVKLMEKIQDDGKIHSEFNQIGAATGRFSSSKPNMQNIPAIKEFRTCFIASEGYDFFTADYSQIEMRLAGLVSGEAMILNEYRKEDADLHSVTASNVFRIPIEEVTKQQRAHGKTANFECLYGSSAGSLANKHGISYDLARRIVNGFWGGYSVLNAYKNKIGRETLINEFCRTPLGRIRYFHRPDSRDPAYRYKVSAIQREGFNMVIQGYAADILKYAMILIDKELGDNGRIVLTVHDEVGIELKKEHSEELSKLVLDTMEKAGTIVVKERVPMKAEGVLLDSWIK